MRTPYFIERWRIAKAQFENRQDGEEIEKFVEGGDGDGEEAED